MSERVEQLATMRDHRVDGYDVDLSRLPISRMKAEKIGSTYFFTGNVCKHGHLASRYTKGGRCTICSRISSALRQGKEFLGRMPKKLANAARKSAHSSGCTTYVPADPCPHGHMLRFVSSTNCVECNRLALNKYKEQRKNSRIEKLYGLTPIEHEHLFQEQNCSCAICGKIFIKRRDMHIDHCHSTGRIRGLLCSCCNQAIGLLKERADLMQKAAEYINAKTP